MTPDPGMLYLTPRHREALAGLSYGIITERGFIVLTGEVGTGKTTLLARVLEHLPSSRVEPTVLYNPKLTADEFLEMVLLEKGIVRPPASKAQRLILLRELLLNARAENKIVVLVIDEAHALSAEILEEIRLLGNLEQADRKLLQIVLAGQTELDTLLNRDDLRQFKQRIAVRLKIDRLSNREVQEYIRYRWTKAGGADVPFSSDAFDEIAQWSTGIPRLVNAICDNALTLAVADGSACVYGGHIRETCRDLDLLRQPAAPVLPVNTPTASVAVVNSNGDAPLLTLERYTPEDAETPSLLTRCARKLGFVQ